MAVTTGNGSTTTATTTKRAKSTKTAKGPKAPKALADAARDLESSVSRALRSEIKDVRRLLDRLHKETDQALARLERAVDGPAKPSKTGAKASAKKAPAKRSTAKKAAAKASPTK